MQAHQIILTSCRRGITGGGSGFQVYSCDQALASRGVLQGSEYQKLFSYDTPVEVGVPSFGYAYTEGIGSVFSLNTRLAHDFAGEGTRSGNLLNHSLVIDGACPFYPLELYGTSALRQEMKPEEVNADDAPDYLPLVDAQPAGVIDLESVSEWLDDIDGVEALQKLLGAYLDARQADKVLVILDEPQNVVRWVAAMEYCLPLKVANRIGFLSYSENAASAGAVIAGTSRKQLDEHTPAYLLPSVTVFDPAACDDVEAIAGPFADFVDMSFGLNPAALSKFAAFADEHVAMGDVASIGELDAAYHAFFISGAEVGTWSLEAARAGLACALEKGSEELNRVLVLAIAAGADDAASFDPGVRMTLLAYLVRRWNVLDDAGRALVERIAVGDVMALLENEGLDDTQFREGLDAVKAACAPAGLNVFEMLMGPSSRAQLEAAAQRLSPSKLRQLAECLSDYVLATSQPSSKLALGQPVGDLYACLARCAFSRGQEAGFGLEQSVVALLAGNLAYIQTLMPVLDDAALAASRDARTPFATRDTDALWDLCIEKLAELHASQAALLSEWFARMAHTDPVFYQRVESLFSRLMGAARTSQDAASLFAAFCTQGLVRDAGYMGKAYPAIMKRYAERLIGFGDAGAVAPARGLLEGVLGSPSASDFTQQLMSLAFSTVDLGCITPADVQLLSKAKAYKTRTGASALAGKAALAQALVMVQQTSARAVAAHPGKRASYMNDVRAEMSGLGTLDVSFMDDREFGAYANQLAEGLAPLVGCAGDYSAIARAFRFDAGHFEAFVRSCVQTAIDFSMRMGNLEPMISITVFCALCNSDALEDICLRELRRLNKAGDVVSRVRQESYSRLCREGGKPAADAWLARFDQGMSRRGGLFGRFRK